MVATTNSTAAMNDFEIGEELPSGNSEGGLRWVSRLIDIHFTGPTEREVNNAVTYKRFCSPVWLEVIWEPLSYQQVVNREFQDDDYEHIRVPVFYADAKPNGPNSTFGLIKEAFQAHGYKITKNEVFQTQLQGTVWGCTRAEKEVAATVDADGNTTREAFKFNTVVPVDQIENYTMPVTRKVIRRFFKAGTATEQAQVSDATMAELKNLLNGASEDDYFNLVFASGNEQLTSKPIIDEAADPAVLTARLVRAGGKVVGDQIFFE